MIDKAYLILPLAAAVLYALGATSLKSATAHGAAVLRTTFLANVVTAVVFLAFVPWRSGSILPEVWWPVIALSVLFFLGQLFTILALARGAVSIATPILSAKVVVVAFFLAVLFGEPVGTHMWIAAVITVAGVSCLQLTGRTGNTQESVTAAVVYSLFAAVFFALFDVMTQVYSPILGFGRFLPMAMILAAILSFALLPFAPRRLRDLDRPGKWYVGIGVGLLMAQAVLLISAVGFFGDAPGCNVVYSSRGIWSIAIVWLLGGLFENAELEVGRLAVFGRLAGAIQILIAIVIVLV
jgi:drug/metabolite transporter (DMT)-like permease